MEVSDLRVTVYTNENCVQCKMTLRMFGEFNFQPKTTPRTESNRMALIDAGYSSYPVVMVFDGNNKMIDSWTGFKPEKIKSLFK